MRRRDGLLGGGEGIGVAGGGEMMKELEVVEQGLDLQVADGWGSKR